MNYEEYLLTCMSEECGEVSKEIHKALRFGLDDYNPDDEERKPNKLLILLEFIDLLAVNELLHEEGILDFEKIAEEYNIDSAELIDRKIKKVKEFWQYSIKSKGNSCKN